MKRGIGVECDVANQEADQNQIVVKKETKAVDDFFTPTTCSDGTVQVSTFQLPGQPSPLSRNADLMNTPEPD